MATDETNQSNPWLIAFVAVVALFLFWKLNPGFLRS